MRDTIIFNNLCKNLGNVPTDDQSSALKKIASYICENTSDVIFTLTGYAGTGKTSVISSVVKTLELLRFKSVLLAPTGRAAKVLGSYAGRQTYTIHKKIYRQKSSKDGMGSFILDRNLHRNTYFIVDEASMISNSTNEISLFGSGKLLDDLIEYVYSGTDCKLILVGDPAQLPPVGSDLSPALDPTVLKDYGFGLLTAELRQVVRQSEESGVLMNATRVRLQIAENDLVHPSVDCINFNDVIRINGEQLIDELSASYGTCGLEGTIIVVNSNKLANKYNQGIRSRIFFREEEISPGDMVMIVKNNYSLIEDDGEGPGFIANGDIAEVKRIRKYEERYGFHFAEMTLWFPDYNFEVESKVMMDVLHLDTPSLPSEKNSELFHAILNDYLHIKSRRKQYEAVRNDPWFNALQIKFSYAVTCHKAQGGQWERVFIDQGMFNRNEISLDYLRWFYTALTRSTDRVYLVNFNDSFFKS
ncbi:MAG: AAA family ATPase [Bacteroidales bacterium]|nr:AAA family ATPase [Bacteroidales bacterium]NMD03927.1 AAA family ATPase [Bacteroidales bacterium]OQB65039.1 MAG: ATP-dependent RecD-like DNA helicase [Bacteroidetes bacterium ADurb.Bin145]HOU03135.1 AAA family ATPase [Bacteroidales bacterium]HQK69153.1 AAA family ATPase [Bacteroidales bacterium]